LIQINTNKPVKLVLENGTVFSGVSFGAEGETIGEVCFNTGMTSPTHPTAVSSSP